jgi:hypothetical protein
LRSGRARPGALVGGALDAVELLVAGVCGGCAVGSTCCPAVAQPASAADAAATSNQTACRDARVPGRPTGAGALIEGSYDAGRRNTEIVTGLYEVTASRRRSIGGRERVSGFHADHCPMARTIGGCVALSTSLDLTTGR